ncbi:ATP phosphoribosyltransferase regulatory subunit [Pedomonas sp. V897]|uniref:ATP phosphoribosyltransferase regulatory subunit n=1 Tax=Pedomonas sp. V897 TaxID=3446482 RepID=UPI003EE17794
MTDSLSLGLLPEGLRDVLPPQAEAEARLLRMLLDHLASYGYERVGTPLVEFEETLTRGFGAARPSDLFRLTDPISQRPLAVRSDVTGQIARVAATRLGHYARPLRLSYAGPVLRIKGSQLRADRQFMQAGAELIGTDSPEAVAEIAGLALSGLLGLGLDAVNIDFVLPDLIPGIGAALGLEPLVIAAAARALDAKDAAAVAQLPHPAVWRGLLEATGDLAHAEEVIASVPGMPAIARERLGVLAKLARDLPEDERLGVTVDPGETRGFAYQTWIGFSLFAKGIRGEVGRGGAYVIRKPDPGQNGLERNGTSEEPAVGFSLYLDGLVEAGQGVEVLPRLYLAFGTPQKDVERLREEGWAVVRGLEQGDPHEAARAQRCSHYWDGRKIHMV